VVETSGALTGRLKINKTITISNIAIISQMIIFLLEVIKL